jgi:two-component system, chemotaxis family, chemotaxis protein CheY
MPLKRCLIVDDSDIVRRVARAIVESLRYEVVEAGSAQDALELAKSSQPDIIFLDWHMPATNTIELIKGLRQRGSVKPPYILFCMTEDDDQVLQQARSAGINDVIMKPFDRASVTAKFATFQIAAAA